MTSEEKIKKMEQQVSDLKKSIRAEKKLAEKKQKEQFKIDFIETTKHLHYPNDSSRTLYDVIVDAMNQG